MASKRGTANKLRLANVFKVSIAAGAGTFLGIVPQILIGIVLFLSGLNLKDNGYRYTGLALMILGSALGLGLGFGSLISEFE
tara:strand:- start:1407 stop:1652 length:246 start_codon:yes stop_codon:yes gene_type:complete